MKAQLKARMTPRTGRWSAIVGLRRAYRGHAVVIAA
jgi:hypothetical protein